MAKRIATTTVKRLRRRTLSVSFSMSGITGVEFILRREAPEDLAPTCADRRQIPALRARLNFSIHRLAARRLQKHLFEALYALLCVIDGDVCRGERGEQRRRILLFDVHPQPVILGMRR